MEIPVLIEQLDKHKYRARAGEPFGFSVEARSENEALAALEHRLHAQLKNGTRLATLHIGLRDHPVARTVGTLLLEDPLTKKWLRAIEKGRRKLDADEGCE
jgi:hypothetical protein